MATNPQPGQILSIDPASATSTAGQARAEDAEQKRLRTLVERRHPLYEAMESQWTFLEQTYEGGRQWFFDNVFKYIKEGEAEYGDRVERCYRFNHTREVVDLVNKYLFKQVITRSEDAPPSVRKFWERCTKNGLGIRDFARQASKKSSIVGRIGVVVDNNAKSTLTTKADEKGVQTYAYIVGPKQLLDYAYDDNGNLLWVLVLECYRDDEDPFDSSGEERPRWRLWTQNSWMLFEEQKRGRKKVIVQIDSGDHNLGEVPVILHDHVIGDEEYVSPSMVDDIAYLDRAVANYLSNLDAIIQDQTFSQLIMPAQNVLPGDDDYKAMIEMSTKRVFLYDGEHGTHAPAYIAPDPKQAQMILAAINKIINEIYHSVGLAGERTKQDNALGIDNSSGVAKAYDFERVNALLSAKADSLEVLENKIARLVAKWNGETVDQDVVSYPDNFDTRGLYDEFDLSARLLLVEAPATVRRQQMEQVIDKLFPMLKADIKAKMLAELKDWPVDPAEAAGAVAGAVADAQLPAQQALQKQDDRNTAKTTLSGN